ncbi:MAG: hypothetical protein ABI644_01045 [Arenimonas sp.]
MTHEIKTIFTLIALMAAGFAANYGLTLFAAPENQGTALFVGIFLTTFGLAFAKFSMDFVILPFALIAFIWQIISRKKPLAPSGKKRDRIEWLGRVLFVLIYTMISTLTGLYVGLLDAGLGWFTTSLLFCGLGLLLAFLVPNELMWAADADAPATTYTEKQKADYELARKNGDPVVLFTDKVVKGIAGVVTNTSSTKEAERKP